MSIGIQGIGDAVGDGRSVNGGVGRDVGEVGFVGEIVGNGEGRCGGNGFGVMSGG